MFLIVLLVSWVYASVKTGHNLCFKYIQLSNVNYTLIKHFFKKEKGNAIITIYKDIVAVLRGLCGIFR